MRGQRRGDLLTARGHRQLGRELRHRQGRKTGAKRGARTLQQGIEIGLQASALRQRTIGSLRARRWLTPRRGRPRQIARHAAQAWTVDTQAVVKGRQR